MHEKITFDAHLLYIVYMWLAYSRAGRDQATIRLPVRDWDCPLRA
ncbi:hypothetical protein [Dysgonomonas sp. GY75]|nr:hypothetical protein [Dysgonomonas sp. GY75]